MQALNAAAMHVLNLPFQGVFASPHRLLTPGRPRATQNTRGEKRSVKRVSGAYHVNLFTNNRHLYKLRNYVRSYEVVCKLMELFYPLLMKLASYIELSEYNSAWEALQHPCKRCL